MSNQPKNTYAIFIASTLTQQQNEVLTTEAAFQAYEALKSLPKSELKKLSKLVKEVCYAG
jgi:hypothetical protein